MIQPIYHLQVTTVDPLYIISMGTISTASITNTYTTDGTIDITPYQRH
jgi:hypothetical protein